MPARWLAQALMIFRACAAASQHLGMVDESPALLIRGQGILDKAVYSFSVSV